MISDREGCVVPLKRTNFADSQRVVCRTAGEFLVLGVSLPAFFFFFAFLEFLNIGEQIKQLSKSIKKKKTRFLARSELCVFTGSLPGGRHGNPLEYSCLENPVDRGAWRATVHGVTKNRTQLSG